ncbi:MAG TPA: DNA mismatch endonuclease Vsr [Chloroflexia bacterium]|nr:DNA mismatch endonuclease Vsr [Chloroflexia bacterium]
MSRNNFTTNLQTRERMRKVGVVNTPIERIVRSLLHRQGYRFTLRRKDLPGKPDIVLPKYRTIIFVHGCFWHGHELCRKGTLRPKRNAEIWETKIQKNVARDLRVTDELHELGWRIIVIWECETKDKVALSARLTDELGDR